MNRKTIALLSCITVTSIGCSEKIEAPKEKPLTRSSCSSAGSTDHVLREFARKLIEEGAKGFSDVDIKKFVSINSTTAVEGDDNRNYYKCKAVVSINYPADLPSRIATVLSDHELRSQLSEKLEERLGIVNGGGVFAQLNEIAAEGPYGKVPKIPEPAELNKYADTIHKNIHSVFTESLGVNVTYELTDKLDAEERQITEYRWYVNNRESLDLNIAILSLQGIF